HGPKRPERTPISLQSGRAPASSLLRRSGAVRTMRQVLSGGLALLDHLLHFVMVDANMHGQAGQAQLAGELDRRVEGKLLGRKRIVLARKAIVVAGRNADRPAGVMGNDVVPEPHGLLLAQPASSMEIPSRARGSAPFARWLAGR